MNKNIEHGFDPEEIIFAVTDKCNLHCKHCYVKRNNLSLKSDVAISFLKTCKNISKIGFSGGEPFLNTLYMEEIIQFAVKNDFTFDKIMTNGDWWKTEDELCSTLEKIYNAGFDGKFGLSYDSYHNQKPERIATFCNNVFRIWKDNFIIEIQFVMNNKKDDFELIEKLAKAMNCKSKKISFDKTKGGTMTLQNENLFIPIYITPLSVQSDNPQAWKDKKWFKEDYCEGPGQLFYVHPNGDIAPCCGFANESEKLIIGNINQTYDIVMKQASENKLVNICYNEGLLSYMKEMKKEGCKFRGKTSDNCCFCEYLAKKID